MKTVESLKASWSKHPGAWILFGLFLFAEYWNYQHGKQLTELCEVVSDMDVTKRLSEVTQQEIAKACDERLSPPD